MALKGVIDIGHFSLYATILLIQWCIILCLPVPLDDAPQIDPVLPLRLLVPPESATLIVGGKRIRLTIDPTATSDIL